MERSEKVVELAYQFLLRMLPQNDSVEVIDKAFQLAEQFVFTADSKLKPKPKKNAF